MNLLSITDNGTIEWLLEEENPSVRYFTLTTLLGKDHNDREAVNARSAIMKSGIVPGILRAQGEGGTWEVPARFYTGKYRSTVWQLIILAEMGADGSDPRIKKACEFILENSRDRESSGFSLNMSVKSGGGRHSEVIPCLTGNMIWSLLRLGFKNDKRVHDGIEWICRYQRCDDGGVAPPAEWPYDRFEICWGKHTCFMGVVKSLKALSAIEENDRPGTVKEKIRMLSEFLLMHNIYKKSHEPGSVSKPGWLRLGFPLMYQTDILEILDILTDLRIHDSRMNEALEKLKSLQDGQGRWKLQNTFNGKMIKDIEMKGEQSKWITLRALKVLSKQPV
ncbi:MAG TPA: hypothetical protein VMT63_02610 [Bacteroidales bacterium]|nr:hypothetical protein [Bacteroidales bacterium]